MIRSGRFAGLGVLLLGALWTPVVDRFELVFAYFQECWVFFAAPIVVVFLGGILWKRATANAAFTILMLGFPMLILVFVRRELFPSVNPFNLAGMAAILMFGLLIFLSLTQKAPSETQTANNVWESRLVTLANGSSASVMSLTSEKFWAVVLLVAYGALYVWLW